MTTKRHHLGHRRRLRAKYLNDGGDTLYDYELLELLLGYALPRKDTKPLAKRLIADAGGMDKLLTSDVATLLDYDEIGESTAVLLSLVRTINRRAVLEDRIVGRHLLKNWNQVTEYIGFFLKDHLRENVYLIFLDAGRRVIKQEKLGGGSLTEMSISPRTVVAKALRTGAASIIMVHNHPSGNPRPSSADIETTRRLAKAGEGLVEFFDHIIVGSGNEIFSFRNERLLPLSPVNHNLGK